MKIRNILYMACVAVFITTSGTVVSLSADRNLSKIINGAHRSAKNKARDQYRHPLETLTFFGLKPDMKVVEIWPGGGWYQEILAPYLRDQGVYYSAGFDLDIDKGMYATFTKNQAARLAASPELYDKVIVTELAPPAKLDMAPAGSVDMVLTFRNFHNWQMGGQEKTVFAAIYRALKPGGILGITDHQSNTTNGKDGYVKPADLLATATEAGFVLVAKSAINENPKDNHTHEKGVWTLLPRLAGDAANHDTIRAIGESDRLTYKFIKPE